MDPSGEFGTVHSTMEHKPWSEMWADYGVTYVVGSEQLRNEIVGHPSVLLVYATWCHHCKVVKPEYMRLGKMIKTKNETLEEKGVGPSFKVLAMDGDAEDNVDFKNHYHVTAYPTDLYV